MTRPATPLDAPTHCVLTGTRVAAVVDWSNTRPRLAFLGERAAVHAWQPLGTDRPVPHSSVVSDPTLAFITEEADGFAGRPGVAGQRADGSGWSPRFKLAAAPSLDASTARFDLRDLTAGLAIDLRVTVTPTDALSIQATLTNAGSSAYTLARCGVSVPVPAHLREVLTFTGRWCQEFQPQRTPLVGSVLVENRRGRTSHDRLPALFVGEPGFNEARGEVLGAQLAWSGNYELAVIPGADGRTQLHAGELLQPGEIVLAEGTTYAVPELVLAWGSAGLSSASQVFHRHVRTRLPGVARPRPVTLNTWEAVYFDHNLGRLAALVDAAAAVGVERFVLDDGWFGARRNDTAGLGDWQVSAAAWPDGLHPLVQRVRAAGMEFGLWFEPEGVNPDSDLYRAHPDWTLTTDGYVPTLARGQLVLDFGRTDVRRYIVACIDGLLGEYPIDYIKWDMNRDLLQASRNGRPGVHAHVVGVYAVLNELRARHRRLEIESCASGGGRADLGILAHTRRIWVSDCNDAIDRQRIQRGFSMLFPPEIMGAHIGPPAAHTTGRNQHLPFRAASALFGHLGLEWNLLDASAADRQQLARYVALHKRLRPLLHAGDVVRLDHPDERALGHGVVAADRRHALFALFQLDTSLTSVPCPLRLAGLAADRRYRVEVVLPFAPPAAAAQHAPAWLPAVEASGGQLMYAGLQPPVMPPLTVLMLELRRLD